MNAPVSVQQLLPELDQTHLDWLEEEAIFILRETIAAFERPALLFGHPRVRRVGIPPTPYRAVCRRKESGISSIFCLLI
jgi:hypothetical protein